MNNPVFGNRKKDNYLMSEPNYLTAKFFTENLQAIEMKNNRDTYLQTCPFRLSILELSKILIYQFWYDYVKPKYGEKKIVLNG